jgi:hypothetical protein
VIGLGGKGLQQLDDVGGELAGRLPEHGEPADQLILAHEWHREQRSIPGTDQRIAHRDLRLLRPDVGELDRRHQFRQLPRRALPLAHRRRHERLYDLRFEMFRGTGLEHFALRVVLVDHAGIRARQRRRARDDRREHGLQIERGADGLADLTERLELAD